MQQISIFLTIIRPEKNHKMQLRIFKALKDIEK